MRDTRNYGVNMNIFTSGVATAMITPFDKFGKVDYESFDKLIDNQIAAGIDALLVCGTTGEPPTMSSEEKNAVIDYAVRKIDGRVPVIVGTGSNSTASAIDNSIAACKAGADMLLVVTPYYNKCTQDGIYEHYKLINDCVDVPIIAYNVPGRTGVNINASTTRRLADLKHVTAIKDAAGNIAQTCDIAAKLIDTDMAIFSGDDGLFIPMMSVGAKGLISVASNAFPALIVDIAHSYIDGNTAHSLELFLKYRELFEALFLEPNPIAIKYVCSRLGICENVLRMPLTPLSETNRAKIEPLLQRAISEDFK